MKSIYSKLWLKITSIILFVVFTVVLAASIASVAVLAYFEVYFDGGQHLESLATREAANEFLYDFKNDYISESDVNIHKGNSYGGDVWEYDNVVEGFTKTTEGYTSKSTEEIEQIINDLYDKDLVKSALEDTFGIGKTDYAVEVLNTESGEIIYQNFALSEYTDTLTSVFNRTVMGKAEHISEYFATRSALNNYLDDLSGGIYNSSITYDAYAEWSKSFHFEADYIPANVVRYEITVYIPEVYEQENISTFIIGLVDFAITYRYLPFITGIASLIMMIVLFIYLICAAGHKAGADGITPNFVDKIPFDLYLFIIAAIVGVILSLYAFFRRSDLLSLFYWICASLVFLLLAIGIVMTLATRAKLSTVFSNTVIWKVLVLAWKMLKLVVRFIKNTFKKIFSAISYFFKNLHFATKTALVLVSVIAFEIIMLLIISSSNADYFMLWAIWLFGNGIIVTLVIFSAIAFGKIKKCAHELANGNSHAKVGSEYVFGSYKECADYLNNIGHGIEQAIQERMKSERLKTELITNVSHDLKTPLTSIVNYIDILSKEDIQPQEAKEHVEVLVRQSQRMKKLIDDLIEASKASSGATKTELVRSDLGMLLSQSVVEYEEKFINADLKVKLMLPENELIALIDGKLMWRVFDNMLNNICKYTQPGTRVYITAVEKGDDIEISFKNISKYELNISGDELMERFVRGDSSRSTEGSGLGLSIAKSLCTLQNANLSLDIDGDLFKVYITVPKLSDEDLINE